MVKEVLREEIAAARPVFLRMAEEGRSRLFWLDSTTALAPGGHNGPYMDLESPVRNSAHWLVTMSLAFHLTGDENFRHAGTALARYLTADAPSVDSVNIHRQRFPKDWTNGIIGPAWLSEGLVAASRYLGLTSAAVAGAAGLRRLGFDDARGLWKTFDPSTGSHGIDRTVNHQLYCSAIAAEFPDDETLHNRVQRFVEVALPRHVRVDEDGLLEHHLADDLGRRVGRRVVEAVRLRLGSRVHRAALRHGAVADRDQRNRGYHLFSLYAAFRLGSSYGSLDIMDMPAVHSAAKTLMSLTADTAYRDNVYTFGYNPPGFELPFVALRSHEREESLSLTAHEMLKAQLNRTLDQEVGLFTRSTSDPLTLAARAFELGYLLV